MSNVTINYDSLADIIRRGNTISVDADQFYDDASMIRNASQEQLAEAAQKFLRQYGEHDIPVVLAVRDYLAAFPYGTLAEPAKNVLKTAIAFKKALDSPCQIVQDLVQAAGFTTQLNALCLKLLGYTNRARNYSSMPEREGYQALRKVFETWLESVGEEASPLPARPYSKPMVVNLSSNTLNDLVERAQALAKDIQAFADHVLALKLVSYDQLEEAARPFCEESQKWTRVGRAAIEFVNDKRVRDTMTKTLLEAAKNHATAFGSSPELSCLTLGAIHSWSLADLTIRTQALSRLAASYGDMRSRFEFEALSTVFARAMTAHSSTAIQTGVAA